LAALAGGFPPSGCGQDRARTVSADSPSWTNLAELDFCFAQSRRRAAERRARASRARPGSRPLRGLAVLAALLLLAGALGIVQIAADTKVRAGAAHARRSQAPATAAGPRCPIPARFRAAFSTAVAKTGLPLALLTAVAEQESRMDPAARSGAGAQGLLQLMPETARSLLADPLVPTANVLAGARYLRGLLDRFGRLDLALAAYNAGPTAVAAAGGAPTKATLTYVANVEARAAALAGCA
jgi:soluble lytic murein transglycosylase-like protein